jgi:putative glutathione S-transferase
VYELCSPGYRGRCTAPVLVDKRRRRAVNNESSELIRMLAHFPRYVGSSSWLPPV